MAIEIVSFPMKNGWIFPWFLYVYQAGYVVACRFPKHRGTWKKTARWDHPEQSSNNQLTERYGKSMTESRSPPHLFIVFTLW